MLFDTPDTVLKTQTLNKAQKDGIKHSLSSSRYSKLEYNKAEANISATSHHQQPEHQINRAPLFEFSEDLAPPISDDDEDTLDYTASYKENDALLADVITELEYTKLPLSPSIFYSDLNNLSEFEKKVVDLNASKLVEKFQVNKSRTALRQRSLREKNDLHKIRLDELKKERIEAKASLVKEPKETCFKSFKEIEEIEKKSEDEIEIVPPKFELVFEEPVLETYLSKVKALESHLMHLAGQFRQLGLRCEDVEYRDLFDRNFNDSLRASVLCVEKVSEGDRCSTSMNETQLQNRLFDLRIIEAKYSQILEEFEARVDSKLEQYIKHKERLEQESLIKQLQKEKKEAEIREIKQKKYLNELDKYSVNCREALNFLSGLEANLNKKFSVVEGLANQVLVKRIETLTVSIRSEISRVELFSEESIKGCRSVNAWELSDKQMTDFHKGIKEDLAQFEIAVGELDIKVKEFWKSVEDALKEKDRKEKENMEAARMAEEAIKLKEAAEKRAEDTKKLNEAAEKAASEQKEKELCEAKQRTAQAKVETTNRVKAVNEDDKNGVNSLTFVEFNKRKDAFVKLVSDVEEPFKETALKMYKFDLQKAVNFPLNSMLEDKSSEDNKKNFNEKIKTLLRLLKGDTCTITSTLTVNPTKHAQGVNFCLVYLARKLVEKGEETVGSRPETAFQYSQLIVDVLRQVPRFETVILSQMQETCPLIVPYYKPRQSNQSDEQYLSSLGYKTINGKIEEEVHFIKRMSGVLHLYFTVLITVDSSLGTTMGLRNAWQWISDVLNLAPRPNLTAEMLTIFFKCCGYKMQANYGRQFNKLVGICLNEFLDLVKLIPKEKQSGASIGRLESVLEQFKKYNRFAEWKNVS